MARMGNRSQISVPSKDLVRKVRTAYTSIPDDSRFDRHLLIWSVGEFLRATFVSDVPEGLFYRGSMYQLQQPYAGDWDPLLDSPGRLVGMRIAPPKEERLLTSDFLRRHKQLRLADQELHILPGPDVTYEIEMVQGVGTRLYANSKADYMFLFPEWGEWGEVGFPLASDEIPDLR